VNGLLSLPSGPLEIVARTAIIFLVVVVGLRLGGKREVGQLGVIDLVALLLLSNAVQNAMVGDDTTLAGGVIAAVVILVSARIFDLLVQRFPRLRRAVVGEPRVLISHGDVWRRALREEEVSMDELNEALREHGLEHTRDVKLAILEVDGSISIIPEPEAADRYQAGEGPDSKSRRAGRIPRHTSRQRGQISAPPVDPADPADPASKEIVS
jgi:uncharacterized membrane protein YcaP (DUF421 family)